jgi:thiamine monophosphate kinase
MNAITAGDDYELLFTVRPQRRGRLGNVRTTGVPITRIGLCTPNRDVLLKRVSGVTEPLRSGFSHFR